MPRKIPSAKTPRIGPAPADRTERSRFYVSGRWRRLRAAFLAEHPLCSECLKAGRLTPAEVVHHVKERLKHPELALDPDNIDGLCNPCHTRLHKRA